MTISDVKEGGQHRDSGADSHVQCFQLLVLVVELEDLLMEFECIGVCPYRNNLDAVLVKAKDMILLLEREVMVSSVE
jgi:hypothetical protein